MTDNVVDIRPDAFLRAMRDTGDWAESCKKAGIAGEEIANLCLANPKFDLATIEAQMEFLDDKINSEKLVLLEAARQAHMKGFRERHPVENADV